MKIDRNRLLLVFVSALPLVIASAISIAIADASLIGGIIGTTPDFSPAELLIQAVFSTLLGALVVFSLFWVMNKKGKGAKKVVVAFVVSPILFFVSIFLGQAFLLILFKGTSSVFQGVILMISLGVSMMSIALIVIDAIPRMLRNIFVAFYGSIFGIFMGVTFVTSSMFVLIVSLIVEDYFLTRYSPTAQAEALSGTVGKDPFDYTRIQSDSIAVGVGDYVAFSLIASHAFIYFPVYVWLMSVLMALVGIIINIFVIAEEDKILPGIPLPGALALFPWFVHIVSSFILMG